LVEYYIPVDSERLNQKFHLKEEDDKKTNYTTSSIISNIIKI
jgi:hypothetical protein